MGSTANVMVVGDDECGTLNQRARVMIDDFERAWSRFLPDSDISRLNAAGGEPVRVQPSTITLIESMVQAWYVTNGAFDPTLLVPLVSLGYGSSWHEPAPATSLRSDAICRGRPDLIRRDAGSNVVRLDVGTVLDPGAIGKGLAADLVADELLQLGARGVMVDIGGDIAVRGDARGATGWTIAIDGSDDVLLLRSGGVATSGTELHRWHQAGQVHNHVLDPGTGASLPIGNDDVVEVTVAAGTAAWAEVFATALLVDGVAPGLSRVEQHQVAARVRMGDGSVAHSTGWDELARRGVSR